MEIEFMAEFTEGMSRDRARQIIKGKRTKRQRPCSPFATSTTSDNSANNNCLIDNLFDNSTPDQSPAMSSDASTKEDEDMANCLILLAQSVSPVKEKENSDQIRRKTVTTITSAKSGFYVYECKTCNRTFPSFQALGGHRASHKKPKVNVEEKRSGLVTPPSMEHVDDEKDNDQHKAVEEVTEEEETKATTIGADNVMKSPLRSTSSVQTGIVMNNVNNTKVKVHECSICGSEFLSGQALGGHMRKHRPILPTVNRTVISMNTDDMTCDEIVLDKSGSGMLSLDLNFPPPEVVEDHRQSKFQFSTAGSSQERLVFSAPAFVDCRY